MAIQNRTSITVDAVTNRLGASPSLRGTSWREQHVNTALARTAEALPVRCDMATLLTFVRDEKVVGTQGKGNMPLKVVHAITARFVDPPKLEGFVGERYYELRSEEHFWPLFFLHVLAEVGGLLKTGQARRWRLTSAGERFLDTEPALQAPFLLAVWWYRVNWLIAYSYTGMGDALPPFFNRHTLAGLRALPTGRFVAFNKFADELIGKTGLTWGAREHSFARSALHGSIQRMAIDILADFGALQCRYRQESTEWGMVRELAAFKVTMWGAALLDAVAIVGG